MQEKFALRKTLKKVAAIGTSLAMVGVTLSGAMAAGLSDYGSTFSRSNTVVVFGEAGTDSVAVSDVVAGLPGAAASTAGEVVAGALSIDDFEQGERENFEPGNNLNDTVGFGAHCFTDTDSTGLVDWEQNIDINTDTDYDAHEEFCFGKAGTTARLTTSLHAVDDDLGTEPIIFIPKSALNYSIVFEEDIAVNNRFSNASTSDEIMIENFLGSTLLVTGANVAGNQITALVGEQFQVHSGDTVVADECTLEVVAVDTSTIHVNVNGKAENIDEGENKRVTDDCEVHVDSVIETTDGEGIAILFVGDQASESFTNGDHYAGEDKTHFLWEWQLSNLAGPRPVIGARLAEGMQSDRTDLEDQIMDLGLLRANRRHLAVGDYICLPNYHQCLVLEGPNTETNRCTISFDAEVKDDLPGTPSNTRWFGAESSYTDVPVLEIEASGCGTDKGLKVSTDAGANYAQETDRILLFRDANLVSDNHVDGSNGLTNNTAYGEILLYYENANSNITGPHNLSTASLGYDAVDANSTFATEAKLFEIDNDDFDNAEVNLWAIVNSTSGATLAHNRDVILVGTAADASIRTTTNTSIMALLRVELDDEGAATDGSAPSLWFEAGFVSATSNGIDRLGAVKGEDTYKYVRYGVNASGGVGLTNSSISDFDNDVVANSGIIIKTIEDLYDSDELDLEVPDDDEYEWWVKVAKPKEGVVATGGSVVSSSVSMSDQEVGDINTLGKNVVAVGGPAVNEVAAELLGVDFPTYGADLAGLEEGTAVLEMKSLSGGKQAVLVYGWEQDDTRRAAVLLRDPSVLSQKLADAGLSTSDSVTVGGTGFEVAGITVSA